MGTKLGQFRTYDNDLITVTFSGDKVTSGEITLAASPVILQMDGGGREYKPVQYTTASISCVSNGIELFDLCTQEPLGVAVEVKNITQNTIQFCGYITPNTFNQSIDGIKNVVTIECVDWLGMAQFVRYRQKEEVSLSVLSVRELMLHCVSIIAPSAQIMLEDFIDVWNGIGVLTLPQPEDDESFWEDIPEVSRPKHTNRYPELILAESCFFDHPAEPSTMHDGSVNRRLDAMTLYDVFTIIARSFRATWLQVGRTVLLVDVLKTIAGCERPFFLLSENVLSSAVHPGATCTNIASDMISSSGNNMSIINKYDNFSLENKEQSTTAFIPFLQTNYLKVDGLIKIEDEGWVNDSYIYNYYVLLSSRTIVIGSLYGSTTNAKFLACKASEEFSGKPAIYIRWDDSWENYLRMGYGDYFECQKEFLLPVVASRTQYLAIELEAGGFKGDKYRPYGDGNTTLSFLIVLKCGELYYNSDTGEWQTELVEIPLVMGRNSGQWCRRLWTFDLPWETTAGTSPSGLLDIRIISKTSGTYSNVYIRHFTAEVLQNKLLKTNDDYRWGNEESSNALDTVSPPITFGPYKTECIFSTLVEGVNYVSSDAESGNNKGYSGEIRFSDGANGFYSMRDRIEHLATFGDGIEFNLNLKDPHNCISPLTAFASPMWDGYKAVMGYQRDIERNTITVTLD